jgi:hypothetical protein
MNGDKISLRSLVDKWLAPTAQMPARVTRFGRASSNRHRYVRVEACVANRPLTIFFFRHDDGAWRVFPPTHKRPSMRARLTAN